MLRHAFVSGLLISALLVLPPTARAQVQQPACTARTDVLNHLADKYSEAPVAMGLANNGGVIEVLSSKTGESWTIIITMPNGTACMIAAGESWEQMPKVAKLAPTT